MKNLLLVFLALLSTSLSAVEYGYLRINDYVELLDGDTFEILSASNKGTYQSRGIMVFDSSMDLEDFNYGSTDYTTYSFLILESRQFDGSGSSDSFSGRVYCGPCKIISYKSDSDNDARGILNYKITRASEYLNSNTFSIVNNTETSTHNIVVETSTDLENWTPVHSSGLTGSSEQIYVRTRISASE